MTSVGLSTGELLPVGTIAMVGAVSIEALILITATDLPVWVAGAHPKGCRELGEVGPYVVAFMDQGPIERGHSWPLICRAKE